MRKLSGLMSRWRKCFEWKYSTRLIIWSAQSRVVFRVNLCWQELFLTCWECGQLSRARSPSTYFLWNHYVKRVWISTRHHFMKKWEVHFYWKKSLTGFSLQCLHVIFFFFLSIMRHREGFWCVCGFFYRKVLAIWFFRLRAGSARWRPLLYCCNIWFSFCEWTARLLPRAARWDKLTNACNQKHAKQMIC